MNVDPVVADFIAKHPTVTDEDRSLIADILDLATVHDLGMTLDDAYAISQMFMREGVTH